MPTPMTETLTGEGDMTKEEKEGGEMMEVRGER